MASTIIKFPDGRVKEGQKVVTAYHEVNGTDYMITDTEEFDNGNKVVGVSYKPVGEDRFRNIIDMEEWKKAKGLLIDNVHGKKDGYEYLVLAGETLVTEDYKKNLALKEETLGTIIKNYEEFLNNYNATIENNVTQTQPDVIPFPNQGVTPIVGDSVGISSGEPISIPTQKTVEQPQVGSFISQVSTPSPSISLDPTPSVVPMPTPEPIIAPSIEPTPIVDNNIVEFPTAQNMKVTLEQPQVAASPVMPTPVIAEEQVTNNIFAPDFGNQNAVVESQNQVGESSVINYYDGIVKSLVAENEEMIKNFENINNKYKEITNAALDMNDKLLENCKRMNNAISEIGTKAVGILSEVSERDKLSVLNFEKSQQILASQNNDYITRDLTKAA